MKESIKKRIEAVRRGEVPEGYRRTKDIGIAPSDWRVGQLSDVLHNKQRPVPKPDEPYWRLGIRSWAKGTFHAYVDDHAAVDMDELYVVQENDLVVNITFAWEHAIAVASKEDDGLLVSHRFPTYTFDGGNVPEYYKAVVSQQYFRDMLDHISPGGAGRNRVLNRKDFLALPCHIPPIAEQKKIAEILAICDRMIELKQQLLEEKHKAFRHIMTMLFKGANGYRELGKMAKITMGQSPDSSSYNTDEDGVPLLQGNADISNGFPAPRYYTNQPKKMCMPGDLLLSVRAPVGEVSHSDRSACIGRGLCSIRAGKFTEFIYYYLRYYEPEWNKISQGSTFTAISGDDIKKVQIPAVDDITLNRSINILRCADNEIQLLKQDLEAWQQKKKALMQLLLTGLVRVNA